MLVLGMETSCDETAVAIVKEGKEVLSNLISSQINLHQKFGGVVPELASRKHLEVINFLTAQALDEAKVKFKEIDAIAVTYGPGLEGALLIGVAVAKALSFVHNLPLVGVNHLEGHLYANFLTSTFNRSTIQPSNYPTIQPSNHPDFPLLCLIVSGGHTILLFVEDHGRYEVLGKSRDDAAGEAFDKGARALGLGYPGGPIIDQIAKSGNCQAHTFPRAYLGKNSLDFSFSGLKTSLIYYLRELKQRGSKFSLPDVCASFQQAIVDILVDKTIRAAEIRKVKDILLGGGVAVNSVLRKKMSEAAKERGLKTHFPPPLLCTDNAAMIATAGYYQLKLGKASDLYLDVVPGLKIPEGLRMHRV